MIIIKQAYNIAFRVVTETILLCVPTIIISSVDDLIIEFICLCRII